LVVAGAGSAAAGLVHNRPPGREYGALSY
jgi:hypothetical protein